MRVSIYIRCVNPDKSEFDGQRNRCISYAAQAGHEVVSMYVDYRQSSLDDHQPALQEMLAAARAGAFDALIIDQLYRLSRAEVQLSQYLNDLNLYKISLLVTQMN